MAKPIWAGNGKNEDKGIYNSALERSWLVAWELEDGFSAFNRGGDGVSSENSGTVDDPFLGSESNDFFYMDPSIGFSEEDGGTPIYGNLTISDEDEYIFIDPEDPLLPSINGLGGADQIIMMEEAIIGDTFFTHMENLTVLKLWDGKDADGDYEFTGSQVTLAEEALEAGIREVTGGAGDDIITFTDDYDGIGVKVKGGCGQDAITLSEDNGVVDEIILADVFSNEDGDTIINFEAGDQDNVNDIIMLSSGTDLGLIGTETSDGFEAEGSGYFYEIVAGNTLIYYFDSTLDESNDSVSSDEIQLIGTVVGAVLTDGNFDFV